MYSKICLCLFMFFLSSVSLADYSVDRSSTTNGTSYWGSSILRMEARVSGNYLYIDAKKKDGGSFSSTGTMHLKVGSPETYGVNRVSETIYAGSATKFLSHNMASYTGYPKDFYIRYESNEGGWAWAGPIKVTYTEPTPGTPLTPSASVNGPTSVSVSWNSIQYAQNYALFRATSSSGSYTQIQCSSIRSRTDSGTHLAANTYYYYKIKAGNSQAACTNYSSGTGWSGFSSYQRVRTESYGNPYVSSLSSNQTLNPGGSYSLRGTVYASSGDRLNKVTASVTGPGISGSNSTAMTSGSINSSSYSLTGFTFRTSTFSTPGTYTVGIWADTQAHAAKLIGQFSVSVIDITPNVSSVSPSNAILNQQTTFTVSGQNLPSTLVLFVPECASMASPGGSSSSRQFRCTPSYTAGTKASLVKDKSGGVTLHNFNVSVVDTSTKVTSVSPSNVTLNQLTTFTVSGQNLPSTLSLFIPECASMASLGGSGSSRQFRCTPSYTAGSKASLVKDKSGGTTLHNFSISVVDTSIKVTSVSPVSVTLNELTTFTVNGQNLPSTLIPYIPECAGMTSLGGSGNSRQFRCTPSYTAGVKASLVKGKTEGETLYNFNVTVVDTSIKVTSVSPTSVTLNQPTTFTVSGQNLPSTLIAYIPECEDMTSLGGNGSSHQFSCTPSYTEGTKASLVKDKTEGTTLYAFNVSVMDTSIKVTSVSPTNVTLNQPTTFTVSGQNLPSTLIAYISECEGMTSLGGSDNSRQFSCTPSYTVGTKASLVKDQSEGTTLYSFNVSVTETSSTETTESFQNRWRLSNLSLNSNAQWVIKDRSDYSAYNICQLNNSSYCLNIEDGSLKSSSIQEHWHSALWTFESVGDGYVRIKNKWQPDVYINVETSSTPQASTILSGWISAHWKRAEISTENKYLNVSDWAQDAAEYMVLQEIVDDSANHDLQGTSPTNRAELATMLYRALGGGKSNADAQFNSWVGTKPESVFLDVNDATVWYYDEVTYLSHLRFNDAVTVFGRGSGNAINPLFNPANTISRAWALKAILESWNIAPLNSFSGVALFDDVPASHPAAGYIYRAVQEGLVNGDDETNTYRPDDPVNRQDLFVILHRLLDSEANVIKKLINKPVINSDSFSQDSTNNDARIGVRYEQPVCYGVNAPVIAIVKESEGIETIGESERYEVNLRVDVTSNGDGNCVDSNQITHTRDLFAAWKADGGVFVDNTSTNIPFSSVRWIAPDKSHSGTLGDDFHIVAYVGNNLGSEVSSQIALSLNTVSTSSNNPTVSMDALPAQVNAGTQIILQGEAEDSGDSTRATYGIREVMLEYSVDGSDWQSIARNLSVDENNIWRYEWFALDVTGSLTVRVLARNVEGRVNSGSVTSSTSITPQMRISGYALDVNGQPLENATITLNGSASSSVLSDNNGSFSFSSLLVGTYTVQASKSDLQSSIESIFISTSNPKQQIQLVAINTIPDLAVIVSSITPASANLNEFTTFTVNGSNLPSSLVFELGGCANIIVLPPSADEAQFQCKLDLKGSQSGVIKNSDGIVLKTFVVSVVNPLDKDDDGMLDVWEVTHGFNPDDPSDQLLDQDGDGLTNLDEFGYGTNPNKKDSDGDGMDDEDEIDSRRNPNDPKDGANPRFIVPILKLLLG